jgi:hypothetical protein
MRSVSGRVTGVSSLLDHSIQFELATKVDGTGPVFVKGVLPPPGDSATNRINLQLQNVDLVPASAYAGKYLGYRLRKGKLNLEVNYEMTGRKIQAQNVVKLDQLTLGEKVASPDATKLPVKLGVAILKDRNGVIELAVPVEGDLDDPSFRLGDAILHVLGNIMTKLVTSPFAMLGSIFGGKGEEVSYQPFKPGSADLLHEHRGKLETLLKGLQERPGLQLAIEGSFDPQADSDALRLAKLELRFRTEKWQALSPERREPSRPDTIEFSPAEFSEALKRAYEAIVLAEAAESNKVAQAAAAAAPGASTRPTPSVEQKGAEALASHKPLVPAAPAADMKQVVLRTVTATEEDLKQLAQKRAAQAQQAILATGLIETDRVSVLEFDSPEATNRAAKVFFHLQ